MTTQYATASYQEIIDLHTETDKVSVLGIHTPVNQTPYNMLSGFFDMFQKYHYDGCSFTLVPAARLPADISQVTYEGGEPPIDARDLLNPILWHGAHGESLGSVLNQFYSGDPSTNMVTSAHSDSVDENMVNSTRDVGSEALMESLYYRALTDNTWAKAHPQRGFRKKGLRPLVYSVSTDRQFSMNPNAGVYYSRPNQYNANQTPGDPDDNTGLTSRSAFGTFGPNANGLLQVSGSESFMNWTATSETDISVKNSGTLADTQFFTSRLHGLGWLDTRSRFSTMSGTTTSGFNGTASNDDSYIEAHYANIEAQQKINVLPRLFMGVCLLPPAYKTEQYFRCIINHRFSFKKFRGISMRGDFSGLVGSATAPNYFNFN